MGIFPVKSLEIVLGGTSVDDVRKITIVGGNLVDDGDGNVTYTPPSGTTNHSQLNQLDFASSGHTGFAGTEVTNTFPQKQILSGDGTVLELIMDGNERGIRFQSTEMTYSDLMGQLVNIGLGVLAPHVIFRTTDNTTITSELLIGNGKIEATTGVFTGDGSGLTNIPPPDLSGYAPLNSPTFTGTVTVGGGLVENPAGSLHIRGSASAKLEGSGWYVQVDSLSGFQVHTGSSFILIGDSGTIRTGSNTQFAWTSGASAGSGVVDTGFARVTAGVVVPTNGSTGGSSIEFRQIAAGGTPSVDSTRLYSLDTAGTAELFVKDEAGNETQISPHAMDGPVSLYDNTDPLPHVIKESNDYLGAVRYVNVSRTAYLLEELLKAIAAGNTLAQMRTFLNNKGPGFIDLYRVETFTQHNNRLNLPVERRLIIRNWLDDQNAKQLEYDEARNRELELYTVWETSDPETRGEAPTVRPIADIRKPIPQWLANRLT